MTCRICPSPGAISPSQIKMAGMCERKWAFRHIAGIEEPSRAAQTLGTEVHAINEAYLRDGTFPPDTPAGTIAKRGLHFLPLPNPGQKIETHIRVAHRGVDYHGFADLIDRDTVYDWKTTAAFTYALTEKTLATDPQFLIYALAVDAEVVRGKWLYYKTKVPYTVRQVSIEVSRKNIHEAFDNTIHPAAERMLALRDSHTDPNAIPGNKEACEAYGGCFYKSRCSYYQSSEGIAMSLFRQKVMAEGVLPPDAPKEEIPAPPPPAAEKPKPKDRYTLCVNAMPLRSPVTLFSDTLTPIVRGLSEALEVPHYRLSDQAAYGKGDALLAAAYQKAKPKLKGFVYVDKRDPDAAALLPMLESEAENVFRGLL